jgi:hypothetical protein
VNPGSTTGTVSTFQSGATNFGAAINTTPVQTLPDQPWLRTGPGGQTYLALNPLANFAGPRYSGMVIRLRSWCPATTASPMVRP